jgi:WD40 repeat protein
MTVSAKALVWAALAACLTLGAAAYSPAQSSDEPTIPRVKPSASRSIKVDPNEDNPNARYYGGPQNGKPAYAFSADGKFLAAPGGNGYQFTVWDVAAGKSEGVFGQMQPPVSAALSPDGKKMIVTSSQQHGGRVFPVELWDVDKRKKLVDLDEGVNFTPFSAAAFSPDGKIVALGGGFPQRNGQQGQTTMIHFWDVTSGDEVRKFEGPTPPANPDRRQWRMTNIDCMTFSGDGKTLAVVADNKVLLYEVATGKERALLAVLPAKVQTTPNNYGYMPDPLVASVAFSPDGRLLAAACTDGLVRAWDVVSGAELLPAQGHKSEARAVVFSADGKSLLTFGQDNKLLTWSVADLRKPWSVDPAKMTTKVLNDLWDDLRGDDRKALSQALRLMAETPAPTVAFLREKLKPVPAVDSALIQQLIADLRSEEFNQRKKAATELRKFGELALPAMREAQQKAGYDEVLNMLAQTLDMKPPTADQIQTAYGLEVLERIGTDDARKLLGDLAKGAPESNLTRQAQAALDRSPKAAPAGTGSVKLEALWTDMAGDDARKAFQAVRALAARPKEAAPFLRDQLRPLAAAEANDSPERISKLTADLDANDFETRDKASKELGKLGARAEAALKKVLENPPSAEAKRRIEALLVDIGKPKLLGEQLQAGRALEALERMGGDDAHAVLESLGKDAKNRWLKDALADALKRQPQ